MMRSLLYVPADQPRFIDKAHLRGAHCVILDLEDSVPAARKAEARASLGQSVAQLRRGTAKIAVRINSGDPEDVAAAVAAGIDLLVAPKLEDVAGVDALDAQLAASGSGLSVLAIIESPGGVLSARDIARHPRIFALATGSEDLALALGAVPDPDVLRLPKLLVHYAAKAEGKSSFGLMRSIADYADLDAIADSACEAKRHGFDGATCVHPSAVPVLNTGFAPTPAEIDWARRVVAAAGESTIVVDDRMIDRPVLERARRILSELR